MSRAGRGDEGPPDPSLVALVEAVLPLLDPPERWAVYTVPGPRDLPGPDAPRGRRERWWRDHVSAVGGAVLLLDTEVEHQVVRRAVDLLTACAVARERGVADAPGIAGRRDVAGAVAGDVAGPAPGRAPTTAVEVVRQVVRWLAPG